MNARTALVRPILLTAVLFVSGCSATTSWEADERSSMGRVNIGQLDAENAAKEKASDKKAEKTEYRLVPRSFSGGGPTSSMRVVQKEVADDAEYVGYFD